MFEWTLGNSLVAAAFAIVAVVLGRAVASRPALSHFLWLVALAALLAPPLPVIDTPGAALRRPIQALLERPAARPHVPGAPGAPAVAVSRGVDLDALERGDLASTPGAEPVVPGLPAVAQESAPRELPGPREWLGALWVAGALVLASRSLFRVFGFQRRLATRRPAPARLVQEVERVARRIGVRPPEVCVLDGVASPSVWCFGRPLLLWPTRTVSSTPAVRSALITHELAHLARRDHWVSWLEVPASALLWWNPLFWLIRGRIRHFAELSCDAWAVRAYPADRRAFAEALIDIQARTATVPVPMYGLGATDSEFKDFERRLNMIMKQRVSHAVPRAAAALALVAAVLAAPGLTDDAWQKKKAAVVAYPSKTAPVAVARHVERTQLVKEAEGLFKKNDLDAALAAFQEVVREDPDNGKAHGRIGYILIGRGEHEAAAKEFKLQYKLGYERPTALYNLACAKALMGKHEGALEVLEIAARHGFQDTELMATDPDLASVRDLESFRELVQLVKEGIELEEQLAEAARTGDAALVYGVHAELAHVLSADGKLVSKLGHLALKAGDYEEAAWAFERQAEAGYQVANAYYNAACARSLVGDHEGALEKLARAADEGMSYSPIRTDADLDGLRSDPRFAELEERIAARGYAREELKRSVASGDAYAALPELKRIVGDGDRSAKERAWAARSMGELLLEQGRAQDALSVFEHAAELGQGVDQSAFQMARALTELGDQEAALKHVKFAVELGYADASAVRTVLAENSACTADVRDELAAHAAERAKADAYGKKVYPKKDPEDGHDVVDDASGHGDAVDRKKKVAAGDR